MKAEDDFEFRLRDLGRFELLFQNIAINRIECFACVDGEGGPSLTCSGLVTRSLCAP